MICGSFQKATLQPRHWDLTIVAWLHGPALQAPNTSFFLRVWKGSQDGRVAVLPPPERLTRIYVFVIFSGLGDICWCYRSLL